MTASATPVSQTQPPKQSLDTRLSRPLPALIVVGCLLAVMVVLELVDAAVPADLDLWGIKSHQLDGLPGIFTAPFLHHGFAHLWSNAIPFAVLGWLTIIGGFARFVAASLGVIVVSGLFAWGFTFGTGTQVTVGASGWVFGLLTYLLARGIFTRNMQQIIVSVVVFVLYGSILFGVFPGQAGVSWQGHLGGAIGGILMAWFLRKTGSAPKGTSPATAAA